MNKQTDASFTFNAFWIFVFVLGLAKFVSWLTNSDFYKTTVILLVALYALKEAYEDPKSN